MDITIVPFADGRMEVTKLVTEPCNVAKKEFLMISQSHKINTKRYFFNSVRGMGNVYMY